jgi:hypothetical protein
VQCRQAVNKSIDIGQQIESSFMLQAAALQKLVQMQEQQISQLSLQASAASATSATAAAAAVGDHDGQHDPRTLAAAAALLPRWRAEALRQYQGKLEADVAVRRRSAAHAAQAAALQAEAAAQAVESERLRRELAAAQATAQVRGTCCHWSVQCVRAGCNTDLLSLCCMCSEQVQRA